MESLSFIFTPIPAIFVLIPLVIITAVTLTAFLKKSNPTDTNVVPPLPVSSAPTPVTTPIPEPTPVVVPVVETPAPAPIPEPVAEVPPTSSWRPSEPVVVTEEVPVAAQTEAPVVEVVPVSVHVEEPVAQPVSVEVAVDIAPTPASAPVTEAMAPAA